MFHKVTAISRMRLSPHRLVAVTNKRQRELARAKYERQTARRAQKAEQKKFLKFAAWGVAIIVAVAVFVIKPGSDSGTPVAAPSSSVSTSSGPQPVESCQDPVSLRTDNMTFQKAGDVKVGKSMALKTNCGTIGFDFNPETPKTASILSFLASSKFYDHTKCHRLTTQGIYVLQCGDPAGNGTGGPGFKFEDENLPQADSTGSYTYARGTVAMANSGPNTNGSQFFLVYQDSPLPPNYTVVGTITKGLDVLDAVSGAGVADGSTDGGPTQTVVIEQATVK